MNTAAEANDTGARCPALTLDDPETIRRARCINRYLRPGMKFRTKDGAAHTVEYIAAAIRCIEAIDRGEVR